MTRDDEEVAQLTNLPDTQRVRRNPKMFPGKACMLNLRERSKLLTHCRSEKRAATQEDKRAPPEHAVAPKCELTQLCTQEHFQNTLLHRNARPRQYELNSTCRAQSCCEMRAYDSMNSTAPPVHTVAAKRELAAVRTQQHSKTTPLFQYVVFRNCEDKSTSCARWWRQLRSILATQ